MKAIACGGNGELPAPWSLRQATRTVLAIVNKARQHGWVIDHVSIPVRDLESAAAFYDAVLLPLGMSRLVNREATVGYGKQYPEFWLNSRPEAAAVVNPGSHVCLRATDAVRAFHAAALASGGSDEGAPGDRAGAMTIYFGAFIIDPDGNKMEAISFPRASIE